MNFFCLFVCLSFEAPAFKSPVSSVGRRQGSCIFADILMNQQAGPISQPATHETHIRQVGPKSEEKINK